MCVGEERLADLIARAASDLPVKQPVFVPDVEQVFVDDNDDEVGAL